MPKKTGERARTAVRAARALRIGERIRTLIELYDSQSEAAEVAGRSTDSIYNWITGATMPPFDVLAELATKKKVSLEWLASGVGSMTGDADGGFSFIPQYEIRAGAGAGQLIESENVKGFLAFREDWIRHKLRRNPASLVVVEAFGDSMHPTITDGDIMLVDTSEERVRGPAIYFVRAGNEAIVKRIQLNMDGSLVLKSDNPAYEAWTVSGADASDFKVLGKVVWSGGVL